MVCQACQGVLLRKNELVYETKRRHGATVVHHRNVEDLRKAAEDEKCSICYALWTTLSPDARVLALSRNDRLHDEERQHYERHATNASVSVYEDAFEWQRSKLSYIRTQLRHSIRHVLREDGPWKLHVTLSMALRDLIGQGAYGVYDLYTEQDYDKVPRFNDFASPTTAFPETKTLASRWLKHCCENHKDCNDDHDRQGWNPTRLLDVGEASNSMVKLIDTSSMGTLTYVTLSHRWGHVKVPRLTRATEVQLKEGFLSCDLPKTFQEAIIVVRELGYRHLWIDSLCIKQDGDDLTDWLHEASLMHKVYRHGHFNISAAGAVDGSEGLFSTRDHTAKGFEKIRLDIEGLNGGRTRCTAFQTSFWGDHVNMAPLNLRGWVFQERVLSKRVLHFGKRQLLWECRELDAAETFPDGLSFGNARRVGIKCLDPSTSDRMRKSKGSNERDPKFGPYDIWESLATAYSRCSLTIPGDKMVAIMGLAKHMNGFMKDKYIAGMWRRFLECELRWQVYHPRLLDSTQPKTYIAPTWSWLSRDAEIFGASISEEGIRLTVKSVELDYATEDEYGPLTGGRIYLEGILRRCKIHRGRDYDPLETVAWSISLPDCEALSDPKSIQSLVYLDVSPESFDAENEEDLMFCMEILDDSKYWPTLDFLVLRCEDKEKGIFSRVGLCMTHENRKKLLADRKRVRELPCVSWNAEKQLHTICVI